MSAPDPQKEAEYTTNLAALWVWARQAEAAGEVEAHQARAAAWEAERANATQFGDRRDQVLADADTRAHGYIDSNGQDQPITDALASFEKEAEVEAAIEAAVADRQAKAVPTTTSTTPAPWPKPAAEKVRR